MQSTKSRMKITAIKIQKIRSHHFLMMALKPIIRAVRLD